MLTCILIGTQKDWLKQHLDNFGKVCCKYKKQFCEMLVFVASFEDAANGTERLSSLAKALR